MTVALAFTWFFSWLHQGKYTRVLNRELLKLAPENLYYSTHCIKKVIKTCSNSRAFGPDGLCIQFLTNMGSKALSYFAALINHSLNHFRIPAIWNSSVITEEFQIAGMRKWLREWLMSAAKYERALGPIERHCKFSPSTTLLVQNALLDVAVQIGDSLLVFGRTIVRFSTKQRTVQLLEINSQLIASFPNQMRLLEEANRPIKLKQSTAASME